MLDIVEAEQFLAAPVGRAALGSCFLVACPTASSRLLALWGSPTPADIEACGPWLERVARHPDLRPPLLALTDLSRITYAHAAAFERVEAWLGQQRALFGHVLARHALVLARAGAPAALAVGLYRRLSPPYPVEAFDDVEAAARWLALDRPERLARAWRRLLTVEDPLLGRVRAALDGEADPSVLALARRLRMSSRSLQRALRERTTSFRAEVLHARVRKAERLLDQRAHKIDEALARAAGFSSLKSLHRAFREVHGSTPSEWLGRRKSRQ